jgi:hypothetical protein
MGIAHLERTTTRELAVHGTGTAAPPTPLWLVGEHLAAAALYLLTGAVGLVWIAPDLANGLYLAPRVAGITHLFTLGWLTLTIFGALCQFVPVALGTPIRSARLAHWGFWLLVPGIGAFACGVATAATPILAGGVAVVTIGILLEAGNVAATLARARARDVTWAAIAIALQFLVAVLVFGAALADNLMRGAMAGARIRVLAVHLHLAIVGWALIAIVGVSRRMLPMFLLSHGDDGRWSRRALTLLAAGLPTLAVGLLAALPVVVWVGTLLLAAGVIAFVWQTYRLYRARVRRPLDIGMRFVRAAMPFFLASAVTGPLVLGLGAAHTRLAVAYVVAGLLGGIVLFVTGILYKIIPLLTWTARFGRGMGRGPLPAAADLYSTKVARAQLALHVAGIGVLLSGIAMASPFTARVGTVLFLSAILLFTYQIGRIRWGTPIPSASPLHVS